VLRLSSTSSTSKLQSMAEKIERETSSTSELQSVAEKKCKGVMRSSAHERALWGAPHTRAPIASLLDPLGSKANSTSVWSFSTPEEIRFGPFISWLLRKSQTLHQRCLGKLVWNNNADIMEFPMPANPNLYDLSHSQLYLPRRFVPCPYPSTLGCIARPWASLLSFIVTDIFVPPNLAIV